jgi:hypothetical protein
LIVPVPAENATHLRVMVHSRQANQIRVVGNDLKPLRMGGTLSRLAMDFSISGRVSLPIEGDSIYSSISSGVCEPDCDQR